MDRFLLVLASCVVGCGGWWFPLWPDTRTPADHARAIAPRCKGQSDEPTARALVPSLVEAVEPAYSAVDSGNDRYVHLRGARLRIRPDLNVSAESLQRTLECHQVGVTLGAAREVNDDPYVLRGAWLDIHVDSGGDGLVAEALADRFEDAREVLQRARSFAALGGTSGVAPR